MKRRAIGGICACALGAGIAASGALGFGTFRNADSYPKTDDTYAILVADVNRDGRGDVVATDDTDGALVYVAKRSGELRDPVTIPAEGMSPEGVAVGRFDAGRTVDVAVANYTSDNVSTFHGTAAGGFDHQGNTGAGPGAWIVRAGDLDRDGNLDLVTGNYSSDGSDAVSVLPGNEAGTFDTAEHFGVADDGVSAVALGRMNGDRRPDVVAVAQDGVLAVLPAKADGSLGVPKLRTFTDGNVGYQGLALADFDRDGNLDAAVQASDEGEDSREVIRIFRGKGDGTFRAALVRRVPDTHLNGLAAADVNGDRKADVVANFEETEADDEYEVAVFRGRGNGRLRRARRYDTSTEAPQTVALGRIGADRGRDIAIGANDSVDVLLNKP